MAKKVVLSLALVLAFACTFGVGQESSQQRSPGARASPPFLSHTITREVPSGSSGNKKSWGKLGHALVGSRRNQAFTLRRSANAVIGTRFSL
jgi:hypothetical protein